MATDTANGMSGTWAGVLHRNSMALAAEGPWEIVDIRCLPEGAIVRMAAADGLVWETKHGGTCECCGLAINNIVYFRRADGKQITLGMDCALTLAKNQGDKKALARLKRAESEHDKTLRAARKAKNTARLVARLAEVASENLVTCADQLARLDSAAQLNPVFGDMADRIRSGKATGLSAKQLAWLESVELAR